MGWNLPPGVTDKMIDEAFGGRDICDPCDEGEHQDCEGKLCECPECREADAADYYESVAEERRLERRGE